MHVPRKADKPLLEAGKQYSAEDLGIYTVQAGHVFFHPRSRSPPYPPLITELQAFMAQQPSLPIAMREAMGAYPAGEDPHIVLVTFLFISLKRI